MSTNIMISVYPQRFVLGSSGGIINIFGYIALQAQLYFLREKISNYMECM